MLARPFTSQQRCPWAEQSDLLREFHDHEWGEPVADASILFEYLVLHSFQVGFNFPVVLKRREAFREVLMGFDPVRLARFGEAEIVELMQDARIIRSRRKLEGVVQNAQAWLRLQQELGGEAGLVPFFYRYVGGRRVDYQRSATNPVPLTTPESEAMSKDLKRRGFIMIGPMACYNILQTAGIVNDHLLTCPRHAACNHLATTRSRT